MTDTYNIFQFFVAGVLILAWLWVLGRPVLSKISYLIRRMRSDDGGIEYVRPTVGSLGLSVGGRFFRPIVSWREQRVFARRRQIFLGLFVASVGSALAAVVLGGGFIYFAAVLAFLFVSYLGAAIRIGGRLARRQQHLAQRERRRRQRPPAPQIRVPAASDIAEGVVDDVAMRPDATDLTLKVNGSRERRHRVRDTSRRIMFRRPKDIPTRPNPAKGVTSVDWDHLDKAANDG